MRKSIDAFVKYGEEISQEELDSDGILKNKYCKIWFDFDKERIYGEELVGSKRKLQTSGKKDIYKSWHDVVIDFKDSTKIENVKAITSKYGYTILE